MRRAACLLVILIFLGPTLLAGTQKEAALEVRVGTRLATLLTQGSAPGASAGIILPDGQVIGVAAGLADRRARTPMTSDSVLLQGSVGKTYVAAVALQLVHEKKLSLDDLVQKHLGKEPWFNRLPNARDITVRMLMNHTSG